MSHLFDVLLTVYSDEYLLPLGSPLSFETVKLAIMGRPCGVFEGSQCLLVVVCHWAAKSFESLNLGVVVVLCQVLLGAMVTYDDTGGWA